jgi:hypothetical protein
MLATEKNEKGKMPKAVMVGIAIAIWIVFGAGCSAAGHKASVTPGPPLSHPAVAEKVVSHLPTARDIVARYHGTRFHSGKVGASPNIIGQTSTGTFFVGKEFYMVNTFTTEKALNAWLKWAKPDTYGLATKWKGETWVVNKVGDSPGGNS